MRVGGAVARKSRSQARAESSCAKEAPVMSSSESQARRHESGPLAKLVRLISHWVASPSLWHNADSIAVSSPESGSDRSKDRTPQPPHLSFQPGREQGNEHARVAVRHQDGRPVGVGLAEMVVHGVED